MKNELWWLGAWEKFLEKESSHIGFDSAADRSGLLKVMTFSTERQKGASLQKYFFKASSSSAKNGAGNELPQGPSKVSPEAPKAALEHRI